MVAILCALKGIAIIRKLQDPAYTAEYEYQERDAEWLKRMKDQTTDPDAFETGHMHACAELWDLYFKEMCVKSKLAKQVAIWMHQGIRFKFVGTQHASQTQAPKRGQRMEIVRRMLRKATGLENVEEFFNSKEPARVQFPNHKSVQEHDGFVTTELEKCLQKGVVKKWIGMEPPKVVNGLKVVTDKPKKRLCINPMYINSHMKYEPVRYEKLTDLTDMVQQGDYLTTSDDKSGYWQIPLHPDMWTYVGIEHKGVYYVCPVEPFGVMSGPHDYTQVKQEIYRPLRELGVRLTMLLDDRAAIESSRPRARLLLEGLNSILVGLGTTLNWPDEEGKKAQWLPRTKCRFLGFGVDTVRQCFFLPEEKRMDLSREADKSLMQTSNNNRQLAKMAGKMIAASHAVPLAPLFARSVYKAMMGQQGWDEVYPNQEALRADLQCFKDALVESAEGNWWKREAMLLVAGDASEFAYAAYTPEGELGAPIVVSFSAEELQLMEDNEFSSTLREILCMLKTTQVILQQDASLIEHKRLLYETDSQTGFYSVMGMKGNPSTFPVVKEFRLLCASRDVELEVVWRPTENERQRIADFWSKVEDNSEWVLNQQVYEQLIGNEILQGRKPVLDVFASDSTTKVPRAFFSKYLCLDTAGVDAWNHKWVRYSDKGEKQLVHVNGPFDQMGAIVRKIKDEQVDCILVGPAWPRHWRALLNTMPVRLTVDLPHIPDLCQPGRHVPAHKRKAKHPNYTVKAWFILWDVKMAS